MTKPETTQPAVPGTLGRVVRPKMSDLLIARLKKEGWIIPDGATFRRLYPGHWQRSSGHWVWHIYGAGCDLGSCDTVRDCLRADYLGTLDYGEIVAEFHRPNTSLVRK